MPQSDPDRLSADEAHILSVESPAITGHTLKLVVLEPAVLPDVAGLAVAVDRSHAELRSAAIR